MGPMGKRIVGQLTSIIRGSDPKRAADELREIRDFIQKEVDKLDPPEDVEGLQAAAERGFAEMRPSLGDEQVSKAEFEEEKAALPGEFDEVDDFDPPAKSADEF